MLIFPEGISFYYTVVPEYLEPGRMWDLAVSSVKFNLFGDIEELLPVVNSVESLKATGSWELKERHFTIELPLTEREQLLLSNVLREAMERIKKDIVENDNP